MTTETLLTEEQLIRQATDALVDKLGLMEATRFLSFEHQGHLESMERHRLWQSGLDKEEFSTKFLAKNANKPQCPVSGLRNLGLSKHGIRAPWISPRPTGE